MRTENIAEDVVAALIVALVLGLVSLVKAYIDTHRGKTSEESRSIAISNQIKHGHMYENKSDNLKDSLRFRTATWRLFLRIFIGISLFAGSIGFAVEYNVAEPPSLDGLAVITVAGFGLLVFLWNLLRVLYRVGWVLFGGMVRLIRFI